MDSLVHYNLLLSKMPNKTRKVQKASRVADYIIVGGGTAGAVLARRLSERFSVIVLEGGIKDDNNSLISNPLNSGLLVNGFTNDFFWPLGHARLHPPPDNKRFPAVAGEILGGGSSVNGMQYVRGTDDFFSRWQQQAGGDAAWGPDSAHIVYKNLENFNGVPGQFDPAIHGENGPVDIRQVAQNLEAAQLFQTALNAVGVPSITDYNDPGTPIGAFLYWQLFQQPDKRRESSSTAYLDEILVPKGTHKYVSNNPNNQLVVYIKAHVVRILFSHKHRVPRAGGVKAVIDGHEVIFCARKKVILSAGFQSPLLLELSGIGDAQVLTEKSIPVIYNNPNVGRNMLNHPIITLSATGTVPAASNLDPEALYSGGAEISNPLNPGTSIRFSQFIGIANPGNDGNGVFTIAALLLAAPSAGDVQPIYSDPLRMPFYDFNYFTDAGEILVAVAVYRIMYNTLVNMGLTPLGPAPPAILDPTDPQFIAVRAYIIATYGQAYHWTGSCRMSTSPSTGVVDNNGNVFGVENLVVADITIIPVNPDGNTAGPAFFVGNVMSNKLLVA